MAVTHPTRTCARCAGPLNAKMQAPSRCETCIRAVREAVERVADQWVALTLMEMWRAA